MLGIAPFFSLLFQAYSLNAQIHERYIHHGGFTACHAVEYMDSHIYINESQDAIWERLSLNQKILKLDDSLNTVDSLDLKSSLNIDPQNLLEVHAIKSFIPGKLSILLHEQFMDPITNQVTGEQSVHFIELNQDLQVSRVFTKANSFSFRMVDVVFNDSVFVLSGFRSDSTSNYPTLIALDSTYSQVAQKELASTGSNYYVLGNISWVDPKFYVTIADFLFTVQNNIYVFDNNLNLVDSVSNGNSSQSIYMPNDGYVYKGSGAHEPVFISSAITPPINPLNNGYDWHLGVGHIGQSYALSKIDTFPFSGNLPSLPNGTINPKPIQDASDYNLLDSIFICMTGQEFLNGNGVIDKFANDVFLYNYNATNEDLNWTRIYNNGYTQSSFTPVTALPNNRYLVVLNEYNWDKYPYDNLSIHLMIINGNGDLITLNENPFSRERITAFPNPFHTRIQLRGLPPSISGFEYRLVDSSGKEVSSGHVGHSGMINLNRRHPGAHILRVLQDGELLQSIRVMGLNP